MTRMQLEVQKKENELIMRTFYECKLVHTKAIYKDTKPDLLLKLMVVTSGSMEM